MSILTKIFTLFRGAAHEAGQATVDKNALRILDQEVRDASTALARSREELTKLMAQGKLTRNKIAARAQKRVEYERYITGALEKGDEALAREVAEKLAALEAEDRTDAAAVEQLDRSVVSLKATIHKSEGQLRSMKQQIDTVKATEAVQRAQSAIASRHAGANSSMGSALESLERVQQRQAEKAARLEAAEELAGSTGDESLNQRLANAGLLPSSDADSVLARFKQAPQLGHDRVHVLPAPDGRQDR